jgi:metal-responsive CopG/Arc/MetJ family transcriptional regulator
MSVVRMNITLPQDLADQLKKIAGSKKKSHFIAKTLQEKIAKIKADEIQRLLEEGYKARREESRTIAKEFEAVDLGGWDEY